GLYAKGLYANGTVRKWLCTQMPCTQLSCTQMSCTQMVCSRTLHLLCDICIGGETRRPNRCDVLLKGANKADKGFDVNLPVFAPEYKVRNAMCFLCQGISCVSLSFLCFS